MSMTLVDKQAVKKADDMVGMEGATSTAGETPRGGAPQSGAPMAAGLDPARYQVERRDGSVVKFKGEKIVKAITKAFMAQENLEQPTARILEEVQGIAGLVFTALAKRRPNGGTWHLEDVQDQVE